MRQLPARYGFDRAELVPAGIQQKVSLTHLSSPSSALIPARSSNDPELSVDPPESRHSTLEKRTLKDAVQPQRVNIARCACLMADTTNRCAVSSLPSYRFASTCAVRRLRTQMESDSVLVFSVAGLPWTLPCASAALRPASSVAMMDVRPGDWMVLFEDNHQVGQGGNQCRPYPFAV